MTISRDGQEGFAYLLSLGVFIAVGAASLYGQVAYRDAKARVDQQTETRRKLESIEDALIRYAAREKKLPCPADGTQPSSTYVQFPLVNPPNGRCDFASTGKTAADGVVPWKELGLSAEAGLDEWRRRISYRVFDAQIGPAPIATSLVNTVTSSNNPLVIQGGVDLTECYKDDLGSNAGASATSYDHCIRLGRVTNTVLSGVGFGVTGDVTLTPANSTGAAFVLISHGENGRGALLTSGRRMPASSVADEADNASAGSDFIARGPKPIDGAQPFDDLVLAVSVRKVAERAKLEPRKEPCLDLYACYVLSLGPTAYWRLGETSGAATDYAVLGARKHGTYNGAVTRGTAGALDSSIISDRSATFTTNATTVTVPHHADFSLSSGAISFWYRPNNTGPADMNLFEKGTFKIWIDKTYTYFISGSANVRRPSGSEFAWHHLVINWGPADLARGIPAGMKIYIDGVGAMDSSTATLVGNTSTIQIAGDGNSNNYDGRIDEVVIFPRQLTTCEVRTLGDMDGSWPSSPPCS